MSPKLVLVTTLHGETSADVLASIDQAARIASSHTGERINVERLPGRSSGHIEEKIRQAINSADALIADVSAVRVNIAYEIGFAQGCDTPVIMISRADTNKPFVLPNHITLAYNESDAHKDLVPHLADNITLALRDPRGYIAWSQRMETRRVPSVFISYSHRDVRSLGRLLVHLKPMTRRETIEPWADTDIEAGDLWREEISEALDRAAIAVLLVSADFLASDFIADNELPPLLRAAEERGTKILPVILSPCGFTRHDELARFQAVNDPSQPVLTLADVDQERIWDETARAVERQVEQGAVQH